MFTTKTVVMNEKTQEVFSQGDEVTLILKNGSIIHCFIEEIDSSYETIQIGADFLSINVDIDTDDIVGISPRV